MNRRSFFSSLVWAAGCATAPHIFLPRFEPVRWRRRRVIFNPEYETAPYEWSFLSWPEAEQVLKTMARPLGPLTAPLPPLPMRFRDCECREIVWPYIISK